MDLISCFLVLSSKANASLITIGLTFVKVRCLHWYRCIYNHKIHISVSILNINMKTEKRILLSVSAVVVFQFFLCFVAAKFTIFLSDISGIHYALFRLWKRIRTRIQRHWQSNLIPLLFCSWQQQQQPAAVQVQAEQVNSKSQECAERVHVRFSSVYLSKSVLPVPSFSCYERLNTEFSQNWSCIVKIKGIPSVLHRLV